MSKCLNLRPKVQISAADEGLTDKEFRLHGIHEENHKFLTLILLHPLFKIYGSRISSSSYPNRALFGKRPEVCDLVRKLLKICTEWINPDALNAYGSYADEFKVRQSVVNYPTYDF